MAVYYETILLDNRSYNDFTNEWDVPLLRLRNIKVDNIIIDKIYISKKDYSVSSHKITLSNQITVEKTSVAYLKIRVSVLISDGPIIKVGLPLLLLFLAILQPILYTLGKLYVPPRQFSIDQTSLNYDLNKNRLITRIEALQQDEKKLIREDDLSNWKLFIAVKEDSSRDRLSGQKFPYLSAPINLKGLNQQIDISTDPQFTEMILKNHSRILNVLFLIKDGTPIPKPFSPEAIPKSNIRQILYGAIFPSENYDSNKMP
jgi:hypothetical protein